ncbi:hypothetical protein niasHT_013044 [Heterodera trifolii]|uniref:Uncharacterized protein n=1 Tax=Heterodera trifolii TaxID=157864 RepID=A0ABD2L4I5_9BILA
MTAPIQAIVKGCASKLEALLGTEMPPDLGVNALPNQCQRRLYKFRNLLNDLEKVIKKIDENLGLANDYIGKLSRDNAARKETEMQELLQELNIIDKQRAADILIPNLRGKIEELEERLDITHTADGDTTSGIVPLSGSVPMRKNLPKTELKRFDGSPSQWIPFWDYFRTIIHEDSHVPKIEKFSYLDLCIEGKASAIIQGIPISESGYDDAIDLLLKTYGETKRLIRTLNRELMSLQISESFEDDESLYLKSEKIFRQLISMNQNVEDGMYYSNLEGKMSPEVLDKYCIIKDAEDNDDWDTSKFRNAFSRALDQIKHRQELRKNVLKPKREHHEQTMSFTALTKRENNQERNKSSQNKGTERAMETGTPNGFGQGQSHLARGNERRICHKAVNESGTIGRDGTMNEALRPIDTDNPCAGQSETLDKLTPTNWTKTNREIGHLTHCTIGQLTHWTFDALNIRTIDPSDI